MTDERRPDGPEERRARRQEEIRNEREAQNPVAETEDTPTVEETEDTTPVEEAPIDLPTDSDSDGDGGAKERPRTTLGAAIERLADEVGGQLDGAIDIGKLKQAAKAPGNRALDEWLGMGINFLKGGFETALGKRGDDRGKPD